jgi:hypothetical protein
MIDEATDYRLQGCPQRVDVHDFPDKELGKAIPHGVYDMTDNSGWVSVGITHDTQSQPSTDHRRLRWLQRGAHAPVAHRIAKARRRDRSHAVGLPLSARHLEMDHRRRDQGGTAAAAAHPDDLLCLHHGVVPLVASSGAGAEMRHATGVAVFSGMLGVTFFGLFLTPVFYVLLRGAENLVVARAPPLDRSQVIQVRGDKPSVSAR